jgi:hypothetical protein
MLSKPRHFGERFLRGRQWRAIAISRAADSGPQVDQRELLEPPFIIFDALGDCPERDKLLDLLEITNWGVDAVSD